MLLVPLCLAAALRGPVAARPAHLPVNVKMTTTSGAPTRPRATELPDAECGWEHVRGGVAQQVVDRYFGAPLAQHAHVDVFTIRGVPAAAIVFSKRNAHGSPVVDAFLLNRAMLLIFDASPAMRRTLFRRYSRIDLRHAAGRDEFLMD